MPNLPHQSTHLIHLSPGSDERAPGGAVTVELCGHWDHDGSCRWPHHTSIEADAPDNHLVTVDFAAPEDEVPLVRQKIRNALEGGGLTGPDGVESKWSLLK